MIKDLEQELYVLINIIEYYGYNYEDYEERIQEIESKISILKNLENF
tara:strand:+ start:3412 stop:3552 length:141 start_codon:yes stop_codon:yes gene_type:complete